MLWLTVVHVFLDHLITPCPKKFNMLKFLKTYLKILRRRAYLWLRS